jgi:hypothetical protein
MTLTSPHPLTVTKDGVEYRLDTLAYNISTKRGVVNMAPLRGSGAELPGRSGSMYLPGKRRDTGRVILTMWARHATVDGVHYDDPYVGWRKNMDFLLQLFDTSQNQILLKEYLPENIHTAVVATDSPDPDTPGASYREALVEVTAAIDPEVIGRYLGKFTVECRINDVYWSDGDDSDFTSPLASDAVAVHDIASFAGATAPMEDLLICVDGRLNSPILRDVVSGHELQLNRNLAIGEQWAINTTTWKSAVGNAINFDPSLGTSVSELTIPVGNYSPRLFAMTPRSGSRSPQVQLLGTSTNVNTRLRIVGRRRFH